MCRGSSLKIGPSSAFTELAEKIGTNEHTIRVRIKAVTRLLKTWVFVFMSLDSTRRVAHLISKL